MLLERGSCGTSSDDGSLELVCIFAMLLMALLFAG